MSRTHFARKWRPLVYGPNGLLWRICSLYRSNGIGVGMAPKNYGSAGAPSPEMGSVARPINIPPYMGSMRLLLPFLEWVWRSARISYWARIASRLSKSLKVIESDDTGRSCMTSSIGLSRTVCRTNRDFVLKTRIFLPNMFNSLVDGFTVRIV